MFFKRATQQIHLTKLRLWLECDQNSFKTSSRVSVSLKSLFCLFDYFLWSVNFFFSSHRFYHHTGVRIYSVAVLFIILFPFLLSPFCVCKDKQRQKNTFCKLLSDFQNCTISSRIFFFQDTEPVLFAITALYVLTPCSHLCTGHQHQLLTCHRSHSVLTRGLNRWLVYTNMHTHTQTHTRQCDQHRGWFWRSCRERQMVLIINGIIDPRREREELREEQLTNQRTQRLWDPQLMTQVC